MSPHTDRAARAARTTAAGAERPDDEPAQVRVDPIRHTADIPPHIHHQFVAWCNATAALRSIVRVTNQDVYLALVEQLLADEELQGRVAARVAKMVKEKERGRGRKGRK